MLSRYPPVDPVPSSTEVKTPPTEVSRLPADTLPVLPLSAAQQNLRSKGSSISYPAVSHTKRPGNGFYQYVNEQWQSSAQIDPWRSETGAFVEIEKENTVKLLEVLDRLPSGIAKEHLTALQNVWESRSLREEQTYLKLCLGTLVSSNNSDIATFFGWLSYSRIPSIINLVVQEETTDPYFARASLTPGGLTLPLQYYKTPKLRKSPVWKAYESYINVCALELGLPFLPKAIHAEIELSTIFDASSKPLTKSIQGSRLESWMPDFEWDSYMSGLQLPNWKGRKWVLDSPEKLKSILWWVCRAEKECVIALLAFHCIQFASSFLGPAIKDAADKLFRHELLGVNHDPPRKEEFLDLAKDVLPEAICEIYTGITKDPIIKKDTTEMAKSIQNAAVDAMRETTLLSKNSRSRAVEKIHRMTVQIGTGSGTGSGSGTRLHLEKAVYHPESMLRTILSIQQSRFKKDTMDRIGKPSSTSTPYPCFIVNASYYLESNRIVIPWGILHWPFYHPNAPLGWNYGGIGNTIGHEITHAFDLEGSQYSPRGVYKEWFTRKNHREFKKRTRKVSTFYSKFTRYGFHLNGKKTVSEDWADLGGMYITLKALKTDLDAMGASASVRKEAFRTYFISYAVSWRKRSTKQKVIFQILTNVHTPAEDRVDRIVPHFQEWVDAFDIKETDKLYLPKKSRIQTFF